MNEKDIEKLIEEGEMLELERQKTIIYRSLNRNISRAYRFD
jgi:hypothetical protein